MFKQIYFFIYTDFKKVKTNDTPAYNALLALSLLQSMNFLSLGAIVNFFFKIEIDKNNAIYLGLFIAVLLLLINYFYIFRKKDDIEKKYESKPFAKRQFYLWVYISLSVGLFIYVVTNLVTPRY
jgi:archaellum biogenesis protein FlaJ (TadC family)